MEYRVSQHGVYGVKGLIPVGLMYSTRFHSRGFKYHRLSLSNKSRVVGLVG